jgi:hypothetical protein
MERRAEEGAEDNFQYTRLSTLYPFPSTQSTIEMPVVRLSGQDEQELHAWSFYLVLASDSSLRIPMSLTCTDNSSTYSVLYTVRKNDPLAGYEPLEQKIPHRRR